MNLLKRKSSEPEEPQGDVVVDERPGAKNAPTPKREAARAARAQQVKRAPKSRAERSAAIRKARAEAVEALKSTDPAKLPANERVPELVLTRDLIDSRRNPASFIIVVVAVVFVAGNIHVGLIPLVADAFGFLWLAIIAVDTFVLGRRIRTRVAQRFPGSTTPVFAYTFRRAFAPKRMRRPVVRPDIPERNTWAGFQP